MNASVRFSDDRIDHHVVRDEGFVVGIAEVAFDLLDCLEYMAEVDAITLHKRVPLAQAPRRGSACSAPEV